MNLQELNETIDEALVRVGDGWYLEQRGNYGMFHIKNSNKRFDVVASVRGHSTLIFYGRLHNGLQGYLSGNEATSEWRAKVTESSARIADALVLSIIPRMQRLYEEAMANKDIFLNRDDIIRGDLAELRRACPRLEARYYGTSSLFAAVPSREPVEVSFYNRENIGFEAKVAGGKNLIELSGRVPVPVALKIAEIWNQYLQEEENAQLVGAHQNA